jgi:hypothetical protein
MQPREIPATELAYFDPGDGRRIAYRHRQPTGAAPTVLFLPGYASDMEGAKAEAIDAFCATRGLGASGWTIPAPDRPEASSLTER